MLTQIFSSEPYRAAAHVFVDKLNTNAAAWGISTDVNLDNALIMPYTIRLHVKLEANKNSYELDLKNGGTPGLSSIERRLTDGDIFQAFATSVGIQKYDHTAATPDFSQPIFNAPDPQYFNAANEKAALELIYNGTSDLVTDGTSRIMSFDNHLFRYAAPGTFNGTVAAPVDNSQYGPTFEERGYYVYPLYPIVFGSKNNKFKLNLAPGSTAAIAQAGTSANNLVVLIHGFKFSGTTSGTGQCQI